MSNDTDRLSKSIRFGEQYNLDTREMEDVIVTVTTTRLADEFISKTDCGLIIRTRQGNGYAEQADIEAAHNAAMNYVLYLNEGR